MILPDNGRTALPGPDVMALFEAHPCNPLIVTQWFCPCEMSCAIVCSACGIPITFVRAKAPECPHMAEAKSGPASALGLRHWWGERGEGRQLASRRLR